VAKPVDKNILVGFSGGADSTAAVLLLREQGYSVTGLHFSVLPQTGAPSKESDFVSSVASQLELPLIYKDVSRDFNNHVISSFCSDYISGRTPNPCILCNPLIKFDVLKKTADEYGIEQFATGHYARIFRDNEGHYFVRRAANERKDQSYMLYRLPHSVLSRIVFPLGDIESKEVIRDLLRNKGILNAEVKDSQDICFIKEGTYKSFLKNRGIISPPGNFIDKEKRVLGIHHGLINYTLGQRKGLETTFGKPMYVTGISKEDNTVTLGEETDLLKTDIFFEQAFYPKYGEASALPAEYEMTKVQAKLRYSAKPAQAILRTDNTLRPYLHFLEPQRAPTPGQSAVFYLGDFIIGGGMIY
jgi:tRNA-uridine 2-sulfurtransferase